MQSLPNERKVHRNVLGVSLVLINVVTWSALFALTLVVEPLWLKWLCSTILGVNTGVLFVIGHDLSHDALTSSKWFNRVGSLIAFLPSLNPPTSWDWGHNRMHHSWTNLATKDDGYPPPSLKQWRAMSLGRQLLHRLYHTVPGLTFYYLIDVWIRHIIFLDRDERRQLRSRKMYAFELVLITVFILFQAWMVTRWGSWGSIESGGLMWRAADVFLCVVWPFLVWNWIMTFVTIQHHTHPKVRWFDDQNEWSYFQSQIGGTVHMKFPRIIEVGFANIFEHTAHHADKRMPLYNLPQSQRALERQYPADVIVQQASLKHLRDVLRRCRLYDYRSHRWMDFDGRYTT